MQRAPHAVLAAFAARLVVVSPAPAKAITRPISIFFIALGGRCRNYDSAFAAHPKITTPYRAPYSSHAFHQYTLILDGVDRNGLNEFLAAKGIPSMIYYPVPAHRQQMFAASGGSNYHLPTTDWLTERVISLPMHTELDDEQLHAISTAVLEFLDKK